MVARGRQAGVGKLPAALCGQMLHRAGRRQANALVATLDAQAPNLLRPLATHRQSHTALQLRDEPAACPPKCRDVIEIDDVRAMDANEPRGIETRFDPAEGDVHEVATRCGVRRDVVPRRLEPVHAADGNRNDTCAGAHEQPRHRPRSDRFAQPVECGRRTGLTQRCPDAVETFQQPLLPEWFQEIVERSELERSRGVLRERGSEYDVWLMSDGLQHFCSDEPRHLYVEEHQIRTEAVDRVCGGGPVSGLADDCQPLDAREHLAQPGPRHRLVVRDDHGNFYRVRDLFLLRYSHDGTNAAPVPRRDAQRCRAAVQGAQSLPEATQSGAVGLLQL